MGHRTIERTTACSYALAVRLARLLYSPRVNVEISVQTTSRHDRSPVTFTSILAAIREHFGSAFACSTSTDKLSWMGILEMALIFVMSAEQCRMSPSGNRATMRGWRVEPMAPTMR
jgi:hypothetical protein